MQFKQYQRTNISQMCPWVPVGARTHAIELDYLRTHGVSISQADLDNGSPKSGDMIARNPNNHADKWLVAKQYFEENFAELVQTEPIRLPMLNVNNLADGDLVIYEDYDVEVKINSTSTSSYMNLSPKHRLPNNITLKPFTHYIHNLAETRCFIVRTTDSDFTYWSNIPNCSTYGKE